ncbi:MAG: ATP-binding cassette domain-containing protein [Collinsella sp.]|nr:ATP-binding cassette domain-containing protein [Collinsella sp.]
MTKMMESTPLAIQVEGLTFSYAGADTAVLDGVDWAVPQGAFALLVGDTGSGKSTLLSLIKPEIAPTGERSGCISVFGRPVSDHDIASSARTIGYVFQNPDNQIVCESVWHEMAFGLENLGTPQGEMRRRVAETSYFFGMEEWFRKDTDTLSGGRKQLLALASTLAMRPRLLLLDEPTAQLDPIAEKSFLHALFRVNRELGCTVVVATHQPRAMLAYATCAFSLRDGAVSEVPDFATLDERPALDAASLPSPLSGGRHFAPRPMAASTSPQLAVKVERAWFRYRRDDDWVLRNLDIEVGAGRIHALVGGNGCGKSTLLAAMAGINRLQRGRVWAALAGKALLPQDPRALFAMETVDDELMEWSSAAGYGRSDVDAMLACTGLTSSAALHPHDLSGGQQQLLALGKLLLTDPDLLLLDEPTKGLDLSSRRLIAALLRSLRDAGATVVLATHDLDFVDQVADEVSMIFDGELSCTESSEGFFDGNVFYQP